MRMKKWIAYVPLMAMASAAFLFIPWALAMTMLGSRGRINLGGIGEPAWPPPDFRGVIDLQLAHVVRRGDGAACNAYGPPKWWCESLGLTPWVMGAAAVAVAAMVAYGCYDLARRDSKGIW